MNIIFSFVDFTAGMIVSAIIFWILVKNNIFVYFDREARVYLNKILKFDLENKNTNWIFRFIWKLMQNPDKMGSFEKNILYDPVQRWEYLLNDELKRKQQYEKELEIIKEQLKQKYGV